MVESVRIAIIGAGFGGLGAALRLQQRGYHDFVVLEKADDLGGTWRDNSYPGCACDVPSHVYSYSFIPNPQWSESFSRQPEIWAYLRDCVRRFGLTPHLRLGHEVTAAVWDNGAGHWAITTSGGDFTADILISAGGPLSEPALPDLPGLDSFAGTTFHSARWDHDHDLTGRNVAVVGTGASAIQFVPRIQPTVGHLTVFQRTAPWIMPRRQRRIRRAEQRLFRAVPAAQRAARLGIDWARELMAIGFRHPRVMRAAEAMCRRALAGAVSDPGLRAKLTPNFTFGCKRVLISSDYLPAVARPNVTVETGKIAEIRRHGVVTADGTEHPVDTIIFGTGFHVTDPPVAEFIRGRDGRTLAQAWAGSMTAYLGTTVHGFPNLFLLLGPNSGLGHNSVVFMIEAELTHVLKALAHLDSTGARAIEPTVAAQQRYTAMVDRKMRGTVWTSGGCVSWYLDSTGRNSTLWPSYSFSYRLRARRFRAADYVAVEALPSDLAVREEVG
jgi:cation diffusion facilitator CzcD-associated flavoprotein CzcO